MIVPSPYLRPNGRPTPSHKIPTSPVVLNLAIFKYLFNKLLLMRKKTFTLLDSLYGEKMGFCDWELAVHWDVGQEKELSYI